MKVKDILGVTVYPILMDFFAWVILCLAYSTKGEMKGRYTRGVTGYEIVVPHKVSENGGFVSYYLPHFYNEARVRRGADTGKVHYVVPIEGSNRMLELQPTEDFHGPGLVIEHHEHDARVNMSSVKIRKPSKLNCYYHGWVRDEPSSSAAITTCSGLVGAINIGPKNYLIEPVEEDDTPTTGPEHKHVVYRRDYLQGIQNHSICGTKETFATAFEERMKWEEKHGKETEKAMMGDNDSHFQIIVNQNKRSKKWCTTCKPKQFIECQSPHPPCEVERPLFLELAIVIGPRVAISKYLAQDMEQYINTIINIAAKHFQDSSLERPILIKLVRVITLGFYYEELDSYRYKPDDLLKRFCEWQARFNPPREAHPNHHDFVLYLVKLNDCSGSLQGLTNMASICRPDKACGIVNLAGLPTGHVITHMLGHSMGADHDDENASGCLPEEPDGTCYLMAQHICTRSTKWSICSRQCISKFTSTHAAWCMSDIPTAHDLTEPTLLPGQVYSAAEQCRINFEMETYACLVGEFCKHLFCKISDTECVSTGEPPAQGTRCGPDQWCFNQKCVHRGSRPGAVNGEWGIWSQWTSCTKTCGGGVQTANRACDSPAPSNGGRKCAGSWIKSRMCNIGACPDAGKGFLDQQCKNTNSKPYHGRKHEWLHFNQQVEDLQCVVTCINERNEVAVRVPIAIDGTFCKPGAKDVCIRGQCKPVGCDWVIGSKSKEDACGVCHGNGTECRVMQGYFTEQNFQGRIPFLKLPIGTSMILMRETRPSPCFFVISNSLNSSYYLNSDDAEERTTFAGAFMIQGTTGIYQLKANMERIFIKNPLKVPITVSVICRNLEKSIGILYQYALPEPSNPEVKARYTWEFLSWEKCPHACGGAVQRATPVCVEAQGGEVEDSYCPSDSRPIDRIRVCNPRPCKAKWWVGPWSECDCYMKDGLKTRMVMCAHLKSANSYYITIVTEEECLGEDKPFSEKPCDKDAESIFWEKKGERKKRDYMDLVPYSKVTENYSIWDENLDDSLAKVNVRELFQTIDPENVEDYVYLKKIGMTPEFLRKMNEEGPNNNGRTRRRKALITPKVKSKSLREKSSENKNKNTTKKKTVANEDHAKEKQNRGNKIRAESLKEKTRENILEQTKTFSLKQCGQQKVNETRSVTLSKNKKNTSKILTTEKYRHIPASKKEISTGEPNTKTQKKKSKLHEAKNQENIGTTKELPSIRNETQSTKLKLDKLTDDTIEDAGNSMKEKHSKEIEQSSMEHLPSEKTVTVPKTTLILSAEAANFGSPVNITTEPVMIENTIQPCTNNQFTGPDDGLEETTDQLKKPESNRQLKKTHENQQLTGSAAAISQKKGDSVNKKYEITADDPPSTKDVSTPSPVTVGIRQQTNAESGEGRFTTPTTQDEKSTIDQSTTLTVPEVKIAPGLAQFPMYASEMPIRSGTCWKMLMKGPIRRPNCVHQDGGPAMEPAEGPPEWDFVNTSNVKIFVVPIHTTLRTIIQDDNEFVLMETLAKYPVADEMNMVEHRGDAARSKLKFAANQKATTKSHLED